jgi:hypothetical protein
LQLPITHPLKAGAQLLDLLLRHRRVDPRLHSIARVSKPGDARGDLGVRVAPPTRIDRLRFWVRGA